MKKWRTPYVKSVTFEEMARNISARADSFNPSVPSCSGCGECSCSAKCSPTAFYWSCYGLSFYPNNAYNEGGKYK